MVAENLQSELMALAGVAEAEVDESADSPSGVRVRLEPDADARLVGAEVQRVLASHGLRSRITDQEDDPAAREPDAPAEPDAAAPVEPEVAIASPPSIPPPPLTPPPMPADPAPEEIPEPTPVVAEDPEPAAPEVPTPVSSGSALLAVAVEESATGLAVTATATDGRTVTQTAPATEEGLFEAVVSTVGTLAQGIPPGLISVTPLGANGSRAITVIVDRADGTKGAGAAVVKVSTAYAVGRATWSAIHGG